MDSFAHLKKLLADLQGISAYVEVFFILTLSNFRYIFPSFQEGESISNGAVKAVRFRTGALCENHPSYFAECCS